jgi:flagellar biosynthetic protein FlhB
MADQAQRTEKPTPRRLEKARREGRFAVSRELVSAVQFAAFAGCLSWAVRDWYLAWRRLAVTALSNQWQTPPDIPSMTQLYRQFVLDGLSPLAIPACLVLAAATATQLGMTRFGLAFSRLTLDPARLNGFARLAELPKQALPAFGQTIVILAVLALAIRTIVADHADILFRLPFATVPLVARVAGNTVLALLWKAAALFLLLGIIDFVRQRRRFERQMRMSKQEIREEAKEAEGNPQIKQRIRRLQRDLARRHMLKDVPAATAVIVNPTHYAVALKYAIDGPGAPVVVAKGRNYIARRIRELAQQHEVPIVEHPPLAQALFKSAEVGQEIPAHLYRAVAEILAYIFRLMKTRPKGF